MRLTKKQIDEIERLYRKGCKYKEIAEKTGINAHTIGNVLERQRKAGETIKRWWQD